MRKEYVQSNKQEIRKEVHLHDAMMTDLVWHYQERSVTFELTNWEWDNEGRLSLEGVVCMEGSALGLCGGGVESPIYINYFMADEKCSVSDMFARCVQYSEAPPDNYDLPDPDQYFCVVFGTNMGDRLRFVVRKVIWESVD